MSDLITATEIARRYGYTIQAVNKWRERGLPYDTHHKKFPADKATAWILENVINPLKQTSVKEQIDRERLRRERAVASREELKLREESGLLIPVSYVETVMTQYLSQIKQTMLQVATTNTLEILESATDQATLKEKLKEVISNRLNECGDFLLSQDLNEFDDYSEDEEIESEEEFEVI
ncbi:hypothetical protein [Proteus columbae]|uniref:hypothetical protein n=1 Tax=Proteus columbae TaxID=1987580 RepID=UPI00288A7A6A|nr:hypothetical protein [Proteus columbae]